MQLEVPTYGEPSSSAASGPELFDDRPMQPARMPDLTRQPQKAIIGAHIGFKALALVFYMSQCLGTYVLTFVAVTVLSALDFWTTKNISGRLLVGLRWRNNIDADGSSRWSFESFEDARYVHPTDSACFWATLFVSPAIWFLILVGHVLTLKLLWLVLVLVALSSQVVNVVGYVKCKRDAGAKIKALVLSRGLQAWGAQQGGGGIARPPQ